MSPLRSSGSSRRKDACAEIKISVQNLQAKIPFSPGKIRSLVRAVLLSFRAPGPGQITVCLVDDSVIAGLHARYLNARGPTDVMAFALSGQKKGQPLVADIVVSVDTAVRQAAQFGTSFGYEVLLYVVHGMLHVLGHNDATKLQQERMQKKCEYFLRRQGVKKCLSIKPKL